MVDKSAEVAGVTKRFGDVVAVDRITFGICQDRIASALSPKWCGKRTTLSLIAGF